MVLDEINLTEIYYGTSHVTLKALYMQPNNSFQFMIASLNILKGNKCN